MIRTVTFPMETETENFYRSTNRIVIREKTKEQRAHVQKVLEEAFVPCAMYLGDWKTGNRFVVTLTRISPAFLDEDNNVGALKSVRDQVAEWIGLDDRHSWIEFKYMQQRCKPPYRGVRVEIRCNEEGREQNHLVDPRPALIGDPVANPKRKVQPPAPALAKRAVVPQNVPCYAALPWNMVDGEVDLQKLKDMGITPPATIAVKKPGTAESVSLERRQMAHPELGTIWLYVPRKTNRL